MAYFQCELVSKAIETKLLGSEQQQNLLAALRPDVYAEEKSWKKKNGGGSGKEERQGALSMSSS